MSPFTCLFALLAPAAGPVEPIYQVPKLSGIKIDGATSDWKAEGYRVAAMSGSEDIPASTLDGKFRVAWDERGLLVVVGVKDEAFVESSDPNALYAGDSVEMFLTTSRQTGGQFFQFVVAPGMATGQPQLRYKLYDQRTDGRLKAKPLTASVARLKLKDGYVIEALLPWSNLGIHPVTGQELGFQVYVNDSDTEGDHKQLRWYPEPGAFADPSKTNRIRLSDRPSPPAAVVSKIDYPAFRSTQASLVGPADLVGLPAELYLDGVSQGKTTLRARNGRAVGLIDAPLPDPKKPYSMATVLVQNTFTAVAIPDYAASARKAAENMPLDFGGFVFTGQKLPTPEFADKALAHAVLGNYDLKYVYYNAAGSPVDQANEIGRYGAVVAILPEVGDPIRRYVTLYRRPDGPPLWSAAAGGNYSMPGVLGIDPKVAAGQSEYAARMFGGLLEQYNAKMPELAVVLAGFHEAAPDDPPVDRLAPDRRDERYWHGIRKRAGLVDTYPYAVTTPAAYNADVNRLWPTILFLHGSGERGNNLDVVKKVGLPPEVAKRPDFPFIVLAPQCPEGSFWSPSALLDLLDDARQKYRIDPDKLYVTGLSMGGYGAWELAAKRPDLFAAVVPICGGFDPTDAARIKDLPIWAFHGQADPTVPVEQTTSIVDALRKLGSGVRMTLYPGVGHNSWENAYATDELYTWLLQQTRKRP